MTNINLFIIKTHMDEKKLLADKEWRQQVIALKNIAREKGITQDSIAESIGISNVSRVFSLKHPPTIKTLNLIANAINCRITIVSMSDEQHKKGPE